MPLTVGDQIAPPDRRAAGHGLDAPERDDRRGGRALVLRLRRRARRRIVYEEGNFPSVRYLYQAQRGGRDRGGGRRRGRRRGDRRADAARPGHARALQDGRDPGRRVDRQAAHEVGAHVVLDAYQSAGTVPLDVTRSGRRLRGRRLGQVALRRARARDGCTCGPTSAEPLEPALTGWQAHARPFAFETEQEYAEGAGRFLTGTPNVPALYAATAGYDVIEEVGVERIRARSVEQTTLLIELLEEAGLRGRQPARPGSPRRDGRGALARVRARPRGARRARGSSATTARTSAYGSARTSSTPTTSSGTRSTRSPSSRVRARACGRRRPRRARSGTATPSRGAGGAP